MSRAFVQKGSGAERPLVVGYHIAAEYIRGVHPTAAIVSNFGTPFKREYFKAGQGVVQPLKAMLAELGSELGCTFGDVVLVGWSEGCQGIRAHLWEGPSVRELVSGICALDGIHGPAGFGGPEYSEPWKWAAEQAHDQDIAFTWTSSSIVPPGYPSTRAMAEHILGVTIPNGTTDDGWFRFVATAGAGAAEHIKHAAMAKQELPRIFSLLGSSSSGVGGVSGAGGLVLGTILGAVLGGGIAYGAGVKEWQIAAAALGGAVLGHFATQKKESA